MSDDAPRKPLVRPSPAKLAAWQLSMGLDADNMPLGSTLAEKLAATYPPLPLKPPKEKPMPDAPKSGFTTSEFALKLLAGLAIAGLAFTIQTGLPAIAAQLPSMGVVGTILLLLVPVAKMGLGWALERLSSKYSVDRTAVKVATIAAASDNAVAKAA